MRTFIEHHALRSSGHCGISDLRSGRQAALDEGLKHLGGPDNWHMGRLADPKDLLLDLSHSLETNLDPEIASGHHHGRYWSAHCRKQNSWKGFNCRTVFDFEDDSGFGRSKAVEFSGEFRHVFGPPDEGEGDQIAIFGRKFEILTVFRRQGRYIEFGIGQVNAFLCTKLGSAVGGARDLYFELGLAAFFVDLPDDTPPILPSSKKMRSPGLASVKTAESEQPICAGR